MKIPHRLISLLLSLILFLPGNEASCQPERFRPDDLQEPGLFGMQTVRFDCINLPSTDSLKSRLLIQFEIPESFFILQKENPNDFEYIAKGEGSVEVLDTSGNSLTRQFFHVAFQRFSPASDSESAAQAILRSISFDLPPGEHNLLLDVSDQQSTRRFHRSLRKSLKDFRIPSAASDCVILQPDTASPPVLRTLPVIGDALFGKDFMLYFELHTTADTLKALTYSFYRHELYPAEKHPVYQDSVGVLPLGRLEIGSLSDEDSSEVLPVARTAGDCRSALLHVKGNTIDFGRYVVEIKFLDGKNKVVIGKSMGIRWPSMPHSLARIDYAIDMLSYIMTPDEFKALKSLDHEDQIREFEKFWKAKDPTPGTAYNEAMKEFYRRVDYAKTAYTTVKAPDGAKTDRGKISILFGIPPSTEREFPIDSAPVEIWTYPSIHKRFIFVDEERNGSYHLTSVTQL